MSKERPILFSGAMVRAILAGTKTQTRRLAKNVGGVRDGIAYRPEHSGHGARGPFEYRMPIECPYGVPGDRLWVRETWGLWDVGDTEPDTVYRADEIQLLKRWRPAIHMPRALSRIDLEVTAVRVERLQDMPEADAWAEGIEAVDGALDDAAIATAAKANGWTIEDARSSFVVLWDSINGKRAPWESNPWLWVVSFKRVRP